MNKQIAKLYLDNYITPELLQEIAFLAAFAAHTPVGIVQDDPNMYDIWRLGHFLSDDVVLTREIAQKAVNAEKLIKAHFENGYSSSWEDNHAYEYTQHYGELIAHSCCEHVCELIKQHDEIFKY